jgi:uncharacterized protein YbaR (Trm112 family)
LVSAARYDELSAADADHCRNVLLNNPALIPMIHLPAHTLAMLRCPNDRSTLSAVEPELLARINVAIKGNRISNVAGQRVERPIDGGLVRAAGDLVYPIVDQIPVMLYDEAIPLAQLEGE